MFYELILLRSLTHLLWDVLFRFESDILSFLQVGERWYQLTECDIKIIATHKQVEIIVFFCTNLYFHALNLFDAEGTFVQSTRMQRFLINI